MIEKILLTEEQIAIRVKELAAEIEADLKGESVILIGVLKGSIHFLSDLSRALSGEVVIDLLQVSSYHGGTKSSGAVQFKKDHECEIEGRHVIVVEDIVDSGLTLEFLLRVLAQRNPASLKTAALLIKPEAVTREVSVDYVGFTIPNEFVVGYGLDFEERYRALPYIAVIKPPI